jgi:hypothetical protein
LVVPTGSRSGTGSPGGSPSQYESAVGADKGKTRQRHQPARSARWSSRRDLGQGRARLKARVPGRIRGGRGQRQDRAETPTCAQRALVVPTGSRSGTGSPEGSPSQDESAVGADKGKTGQRHQPAHSARWSSRHDLGQGRARLKARRPRTNPRWMRTKGKTRPRHQPAHSARWSFRRDLGQGRARLKAVASRRVV